MYIHAVSRGSIVLLLLAITGTTLAQPSGLPRPEPGEERLSLTDLSAFQSKVGNWYVAGDVIADPIIPKTLTLQPGTGVVVNQPDAQHRDNLLTTVTHGDLDLDLDFMIAAKANSGVYLQGRYEIQLFDNWGVVRKPRTTDVGSVYERWDEAKPEGQRGYDGHPARQQAGLAPGLWQHLHIVFQAPRFDSSGRKTTNARFLRVDLNGVTVQENVELSGPTRSATYADEAPTGPLMLQGDHGPVAFRNIRYVSFDGKRPELRNLSYKLYKGRFGTANSFAPPAGPPDVEGTMPTLTSQSVNFPKEFLIRYAGTLRVQTPGRYVFTLQTPRGGGLLRINNQPVVAHMGDEEPVSVDLPAGDLPFELVYSKPVDWQYMALDLSVFGPGVRPFTLSTDATEIDKTDPILVDAATQPMLRSFVDVPVDTPAGATADGPDAPAATTYRVTHGISVSDANQAMHYTYDLDKGTLVRAWRGLFLDATPMWHSRGDGSARPLGAGPSFGKPALTLATLPGPNAPWPADTTGTGYRPKGYTLDVQKRPTFHYLLNKQPITDQIRALPNGQGLTRVLTVANPGAGLIARIASGTRIERLANGWYVVDKHFYIRPEPGTTLTERKVGEQAELLAPVTAGSVSYSILF